MTTYTSYDDLDDDDAEKVCSDKVCASWGGIRCPVCNRSDELDVSAMVSVRLTPIGSSADDADDTSTEWDDASPVCCGVCGASGVVADFRPSPPSQDERRADAFKAAAHLLRPYEPRLAAELENGCLRLHPGEPFFVVIGRDPTAGATVLAWLNLNANMQGPLKLDSAHEIRDAMDRYPKKI